MKEKKWKKVKTKLKSPNIPLKYLTEGQRWNVRVSGAVLVLSLTSAHRHALLMVEIVSLEPQLTEQLFYIVVISFQRRQSLYLVQLDTWYTEMQLAISWFITEFIECRSRHYFCPTRMWQIGPVLFLPFSSSLHRQETISIWTWLVFHSAMSLSQDQRW